MDDGQYKYINVYHPLTNAQIYGRGSVDMLCTVAAQCVVFARLAKARVPLRGTLLFCAVSDEEAGGRDGAGCVRVRIVIESTCPLCPCALLCTKLVNGSSFYKPKKTDRAIDACISFLMTDPVLRDVFRADYCMTEVGGPTLIDRYGRPTKTYVQVRREWSEHICRHG